MRKGCTLGQCINLLRLLYKTHWSGLNNKTLFYHCAGGQKPKIKMLASLVSSEASLSSWVADGCLHMAFSLCMSIPGVQISSPYKDTSHNGLKVKVAQSCLTLCNPKDYIVHGILQEYWHGQPSPSPGDLLNSGIEPRSLSLQVDSLPAEPPRRPKNIEVGSLSLLQQIVLTLESNWGLLHFRQIL